MCCFQHDLVLLPLVHKELRCVVRILAFFYFPVRIFIVMYIARHPLSMILMNCQNNLSKTIVTPRKQVKPG